MATTGRKRQDSYDRSVLWRSTSNPPTSKDELFEPLAGADESGAGGSKDSEQAVVEGLLSPMSTYLITMNIIVGSGCLGLPYTFRHGGILISIGLFVLFTIINTITMGFLLEAMARADALTRQGYGRVGSDAVVPTIQHDQTFEFVRLAEVLLGTTGKRFTEVVFGLYMYALLWSYAAMFALSLSELSGHFGFCKGIAAEEQCTPSYLISVGIFAVLAVPATCMELKSQETMQNLLSGYRFLAFALMIATCAVAMGFEPAKVSLPPTATSLSKFAQLFGTIGSSQIMHFCFPTVSKGARDKEGLFGVFAKAFWSSLLLFAGLGAVAGMYCFDTDKGGIDCVNKLVTINWGEYTGSGFAGGAGAPIWALLLRYLVVVFPVVAMLSNYPLAGLSFGNNIQSMMPQAMKESLGSEPRQMLAARLLGAVPPIGLAAAMSDLEVVFEAVGTFAYILGFVLPPIFFLVSLDAVQERDDIAGVTAYTSCLSSPLLAKLCLVFGVGCILFTVVANVV